MVSSGHIADRLTRNHDLTLTYSSLIQSNLKIQNLDYKIGHGNLNLAFEFLYVLTPKVK